MLNQWEIVEGVFTLVFLLSSFYLATVAGLKEYGKRGALFVLSVAIFGPGFLFDLVAEVYENEAAELLSHGAVILAGLLFLISFYLSKKELEREGGAAQ